MKPEKMLSLLAPLLLLAVIGRDAAASEIAHNNVVVVLDASGSMETVMPGTNVKRMDAARSALREVLSAVPQDTRIGILVFGSMQGAREWVYPLGPLDRNALNDAIGRPVAGGMTPLGEYIKKGADVLLEQRAKQHGYGTYRLLVVTDGEATDRHLMERIAPRVVARGIVFDVIGVDMAARHTLAKMAHSYRSANDPESLKRAVGEVFAEVAATADGSAAADAFAELDGIPDDFALAVIKALTTVDNAPVAPLATSAGGSSGSPVATAAPQDTDSFQIAPFVIVVFVATITLFRVVFGKKRKRRK